MYCFKGHLVDASGVGQNALILRSFKKLAVYGWKWCDNQSK